MAEKQEKSSPGTCILPISRIRTIMKSSPDVSNISQESLFLIGKSTELFVEHLALKTLERNPKKNAIMYNYLADLVDEEDTLQFLLDIIPAKMKVKDAYAMFEKAKKRKSTDES